MRTEELTPYTFKAWTDGEKVVFDTFNAIDHRDAGVKAVIKCEAQGIWELIDKFPAVSTFYIVSKKEEVEALMIAYPKHDIRQLKIPPIKRHDSVW